MTSVVERHGDDDVDTMSAGDTFTIGDLLFNSNNGSRLVIFVSTSTIGMDSVRTGARENSGTGGRSHDRSTKLETFSVSKIVFTSTHRSGIAVIFFFSITCLKKRNIRKPLDLLTPLLSLSFYLFEVDYCCCCCCFACQLPAARSDPLCHSCRVSGGPRGSEGE